MDRIIRYSTPAHPEDHQPGHCDCSCFGRGFTVRVNDDGITAFGRVVSKDDTHVYIDWYELYRDGKEPENWHADPWPLTLFSEITR
jgi:hypothetical protein